MKKIMHNNIVVSFITVNFNGFKDTCELIGSIHRHIQSVSFEIIVVDNASSSNEAEMIKIKYPSVITIRSEKNLGFSGGNNLGIHASKGEYLFFINNDTYITEDGIIHLINRMESNSKIIGVSPKIKFAFPPQAIQFAGYTPLSNITLRNELIGFNKSDTSEFNIAAPTPYLHGAAMMFKRSGINEVGVMPEIFFLYYEELDWSNQFVRAKYELWYEPTWTVYHKESQSTGQMSSLKTFYLTRNRLLFAWRNLYGMNRWLSLAYQITIVATKNNIKFLLNRRFDLVRSTLSGIFTFITLQNKTK